MSVASVEIRSEENSYTRVDASSILCVDDLKPVDRLRSQINRARAGKEQPVVRCTLCREALYLKRNAPNIPGFHFSHYQTEDPALLQCKQRTKNSKHLDQKLLRALKFNGTQEGPKHYKLKHLIAEFLRSDEAIDDNTVKVEQTLKIEGEWRKPDVQAIYNGRLIAFEVQVSTEYAQMLAEREYFYERHGQILWVLPSFSEHDMPQTHRDVLTSNRDHLFILSNEMIELSAQKGKLHLEAVIHWPTLVDNKLVRVWIREICTLEDISFIDGHPQVKDVFAEEAKIEEIIRINLQSSDSHDSYPDLSISDYAALSEINPLWSRLESLVENLSDSRFQKPLSNLLARSDDTNDMNQKKLARFWLNIHGIELHDCDCNGAVIKSLICASNGALDFNYTSWKFIANFLLGSNPKWFRVFYEILKLSNQSSVIAELNSSNDRATKVMDVVTNYDRNERLTDMERELAALVAPNLDKYVKVSFLGLVPKKGDDFEFHYSLETNIESKRSVKPRSLEFTVRHLKLLQNENARNYEDNLIKAMQKTAAVGLSLPLPNLAHKSKGNLMKFVLPVSACIEFIPDWDRQITVLESTFNSEILFAG